MYTTLNKIRAEGPCGLKPEADGTKSGLCQLMHYLGKTRTDDETVAIETIIDSNGIDDAIWCLRAVEGHDRETRLFAVWCARQVQHLMRDPRSIAALDVAERYAHGTATDEELSAARAAAWAAAWDAAWDSARDSARGAQERELRRLCKAIASERA